MRAWWVRAIEQLMRPEVLVTVAPALVTYVTSAVGLYFTDFTLVELDAGSPGVLGAAFGVALFTLPYALVPVGMGYRGQTIASSDSRAGWVWPGYWESRC